MSRWRLLLLQTLFAATAALAVELDDGMRGSELDSAVALPNHNIFQAYLDNAGEVLPLSQGVSVLVAEFCYNSFCESSPEYNSKVFFGSPRLHSFYWDGLDYPDYGYYGIYGYYGYYSYYSYSIEVQSLVPVPCPCPKNIVIPPLCGPDGVRYDNECGAACRGVPASELVQLDDPNAQSCPTPEPCPCLALWAPQCGPDGEFYSNPSCASGCSGVAEDALRPWNEDYGFPQGQCLLPEDDWSQPRQPGLKDVGLQSRPWRLKDEPWLQPGKTYTLGLRVRAGAGAGLPMGVEVKGASKVRRKKPWRPVKKCLRKCKTSSGAPVCTKGGQVWTDCNHFCARPDEVIADLECWKAAEVLAEAEFPVAAESALRRVEFTVPADAPRKRYEVKVFAYTGLDWGFRDPGTDVGYRTIDLDLAVVCPNDDQPCLDALQAAFCNSIGSKKECNGRGADGRKLCKWDSEGGLCEARRKVRFPNSEPPCPCCPGSATKCVRPPTTGVNGP